MALPSSGTISMQQIMSEFGRSGATSLSSLYGVAAGVPASGAISLSHFYGKSALVEHTVRYHASTLGFGTITGAANASDGNTSTYATLDLTTNSSTWIIDTQLSGSNSAYGDLYVKKVRVYARLMGSDHKSHSTTPFQYGNRVVMKSGSTTIINDIESLYAMVQGQAYTIDKTLVPSSIVKASTLGSATTRYGFESTTRLQVGHQGYAGEVRLYEYYLDVTYSNQP